MMKQTHTRGFTLIELLVVIAIIGILASVVLASLNSARDKGEDAAVRSNLNNIRAQAEIVYDDNNRSYDLGQVGADSVCEDAQVSRAVTEADGLAGDDAACGNSATAWAVAGQVTSNDYYCVDSTGNSIEGVVAGGTADAAQEVADFVCDGN